MRRYKIDVNGSFSLDSQGDPEALQVDMDITVVAKDASPDTGTIRIWGIGLEAITHANELYGKEISVSGGMQRGLPLAKPGQFGLLSHGVITQAYGEWEGLNQTLTIIFVPLGAPNCSGGANPMPPKTKLVLNWTKGTDLSQALQQTLQNAYQGVSIKMNIQKQLIAQQDQVGYYPNLQELGYYIRRTTQQMIGGSYPGVGIEVSSGEINVWDMGFGGNQISQDDMIGFPVWIEPQIIQVKTVMRGDFRPGDIITLPQTWTNSSQGGAPIGQYFNQSSAFSGSWRIDKIHHIGSSRAPTADAWISIFDCTSQSPQSLTQQGGQCPTPEGGN